MVQRVDAWRPREALGRIRRARRGRWPRPGSSVLVVVFVFVFFFLGRYFTSQIYRTLSFSSCNETSPALRLKRRHTHLSAGSSLRVTFGGWRETNETKGGIKMGTLCAQ